MEDEVKKENLDVISKSIEKRVSEDISKFQKELRSLLAQYLPSTTYSAYDSTKYLSGPSAQMLVDFSKQIEPEARKHLTSVREKQFSDILTNLGSYLEMINH